MSMIKGVLFDLDGTLLDTSIGIIKSASYVADRLGYPSLPDTIMRTFVGPPIQESFMRNYGISSEAAQEAADMFRVHYVSNALFDAVLYDGIIGTMREIKKKGLKIGVATYKREDYAISLLQHFGISIFCDSVRGADNNNCLRKSDIIKLCIRDLEIEKRQIILLGDTEYDARGAEEAGVHFLGVTYGFGFHSVDEVNGFPNIGSICNPADVLNYV